MGGKNELFKLACNFINSLADIQIFLIIAVKCLIEAPNINTILSILSALFISIILEGDIIVFAVCNDNDE